MANLLWVNLYGDARIENLPIAGFGRGPILLYTDQWLRKYKYLPLRFELNGCYRKVSYILFSEAIFAPIG